MASTRRIVPKSRIEGIAAAWNEVLEAADKLEEVQVECKLKLSVAENEYNQKIVAHKKKVREAVKEQGAPVNYSINMETGEVFDPQKQPQKTSQ